MAFPLFFFAVLAILHLLQTVYLQEYVQSALVKVVEKASRYAYIYENTLSTRESESLEGTRVGGEWVQNVMADGFLTGLFFKEVDGDVMDRSCIQGGKGGIGMSASTVMVEEKEIDAIADYKVKVRVPMLAWASFPVRQRVKGRAFVGRSYAVKGIVVRDVAYGNADALRNEAGGKYYDCERCTTVGMSEATTIYITDYGTRFHTVKNCPGIRRSMTAIPLSQVGNRHACSKCGGS